MAVEEPKIERNFSIYQISEKSGITVSALRAAIKNGELEAFTMQDGKNSPLYIGESDYNDFIGRRKAQARSNRMERLANS